jgi:hypothetical protein
MYPPRKPDMTNAKTPASNSVNAMLTRIARIYRNSLNPIEKKTN